VCWLTVLGMCVLVMCVGDVCVEDVRVSNYSLVCADLRCTASVRLCVSIPLATSLRIQATNPLSMCQRTCLCCIWPHRTPDSERIKYLPTIYPHDCIITMWARGQQPPAVAAEADPAVAHCTLDPAPAARSTAAADAATNGSLKQRSRPMRA
jgi:hypothetical protein